MYCLVTGGAGSGKSEYAESLALSFRDKSGGMFYIATMYPYDDEETKTRIRRHRSLREGKGFVTIERPFEISKVLDEIKAHTDETDCSPFREQNLRTEAQKQCSGGVKKDINTEQGLESGDSLDQEYAGVKDIVVLLEDLTNLYANECYQTDGHPHEIVAPLKELSASVKALIVVSNELYCDGIRYPEETSGFLRELSMINREIAKDADNVYEVVAGIPVAVK